MSDPQLERASFFLSRRRYAEAEREVRQALAEDPDWAAGYATLAAALLGQNQLDDALQAAQTAVGKDPTDGYAHYLLANVRAARNELPGAAAAIDEAARLDPEEPRYAALQARLHLRSERWSEALGAAERGLALDPDDEGCSDARSTALIQLGRIDEAQAVTAARLRQDPEDADAYTTQGMLHLQTRRYPEALASFQEALRLDPSDEAARAGLVEALKARYPFYGLFLRYALWMNKLGERSGWVLLIGLWLGYRFLFGLRKEHPEWQPLIDPLLGLYLAFVLFSWTASPIYEWLLSLSRYGRLTLDDDERTQARWTGACMLSAGASAVLWFAWPAFPGLPALAGCLAFLIPVSVVFACRPGPGPRILAAAFAGLLAIVGLDVLVVAVGAPLFPEAQRELAEKIAGFLAVVFFIGIGVTSFGGQLLAAHSHRRVRRGRQEDLPAETGRWVLLSFLGGALAISGGVWLLKLLTSGFPVSNTIRTVLSIALYVALYRGQGWARWLTIVLVSLGAVSGAVSLATREPDVATWALGAPLLAFYLAFALWLLFSRDLRAYLEARRRPSPFAG